MNFITLILIISCITSGYALVFMNQKHKEGNNSIPSTSYPISHYQNNSNTTLRGDYMDKVFQNITNAVVTGSLPSNLKYILSSYEDQLSRITEIVNYCELVSKMFNIHPGYILSIAYAETYFGYNLFDPIGLGFGLSQMETVSDPNYNTLCVTGRYIAKNFQPTPELAPFFSLLNIITTQSKLSLLKTEALQNQKYIPELQQIIINDDSNPLISIPVNLMLIAGYIKRIESYRTIDVSDFSLSKAELIGFYYHKGLGALDFEKWSKTQREQREYLWRIKQIAQFIT